MILMTQIATANEFDKHPIYKQIVTNKPNINRSFAMTLSNIIHRKAKQYDIKANLMAAVFMQESSYDPVNHGTKCGVDLPDFDEEVCVISDFGLGQIYYKTAKHFCKDIDLLYFDYEYQVDCAFKVMKDFKNRYFKDEYYWWTRYNSSTPSKRKLYRKRVQRWM